VRITDVSGFIYRQPILHRSAVRTHARITRKWHDTLLVRVQTDTELVGWGEAFAHFGIAATTLTALQTMVAPRCAGMMPLAGVDPLDRVRRELHPLGRSGPVTYALSGVDIALWDLRGKAAGLPLGALLGGLATDSLPAYASMMRYGNEAAVRAEVHEAVARGFVASKLHEVDLAVIRAAAGVAAASPRPHALMVDVNCAWSEDEAAAAAAALQDLGLHWLEEPIWPPEDVGALARLQARCTIALAAGENAASVDELEGMAERSTLAYLQPSVTKLGGISAMRGLYPLAAARGIAVAPHSPYFGPGLAATLHLAAALAPDTWVEHLFYDLAIGPFGAALEPREGRFAVPPGPGLGLNPDLELLHACRI
jgi:L-alanine-DL-glutamate epimerase-like enolase superfamily enzyme